MKIVLAAFLLTTFAGLSTGIGSAVPFFFKRFRKSFLAFFLGLSAGVMVLVSFAELLPSAAESLQSYWLYLAFFLGIGVVFAVDLIIPHKENPHHMPRGEAAITEIQAECCGEECGDGIVKARVEQSEVEATKDLKLKRTGIITALAIAIHNFPEGMATFATALGDINLGVTIAIAIAIHNIPEGISVSIPIFYATKNKWKSFWLSMASGIAEPIGAALAFGLMKLLEQNQFIASHFDQLLGGSLAFVAGIMVYISLDELLPVAREYGKGDVVMVGVVIGMVIMAASLILFEFFG